MEEKEKEKKDACANGAVILHNEYKQGPTRHRPMAHRILIYSSLLIQNVAYSVMRQSTSLLQLQTLQTCSFLSIQLEVAESSSSKVAA